MFKSSQITVYHFMYVERTYKAHQSGYWRTEASLDGLPLLLVAS